MATIRNDIEEWARTNLQGSSVMTSNTEAYNHMQTALAKLLDRPWTNLVLGPDMTIPQPPQDQPDEGAQHS